MEPGRAERGYLQNLKSVPRSSLGKYRGVLVARSSCGSCAQHFHDGRADAHRTQILRVTYAPDARRMRVTSTNPTQMLRAPGPLCMFYNFVRETASFIILSPYNNARNKFRQSSSKLYRCFTFSFVNASQSSIEPGTCRLLDGRDNH
jgi:hypothetical protein